MEFVTKTYRQLNDELLDELSGLENRIFDEPYSREKIERETFREK